MLQTQSLGTLPATLPTFWTPSSAAETDNPAGVPPLPLMLRPDVVEVSGLS